jgi:hypothetical protein
MKRSCLAYVVVVLGVLAACGGDDSGMKENAATGKGKGDAGKSGGESGDTRICGSDTCKRPADLKDETLCCIDNFAGGCGIKNGAGCRPIPKTDSRCPAPEIMVNIPGASGMKIFGCCTSAGECGVDFGTSCQPRTAACGAVGPDQVDKIKPQKCTGEELPLPANCGMGGIRFPGFAGSSG